MLHLNEKKVKRLLGLIKNKADRKTVKKFLDELQEGAAAKSSPELEKRRIAKKALDIIIRIGLEIGKHELISEFLHLFD